MPVAGKIVLITGAARGLGFEYARALGAAGAHVVAGEVEDQPRVELVERRHQPALASLARSIAASQPLNGFFPNRAL